MADLNALIAQGAQFQAPTNPFAQYGQMQQLQQGQQQNQINQMKMQEMQRGVQEQEGIRNYLRQTPNFDPLNPEHQAGLLQVAPAIAPKLLESFLTAKKTGSEINAAGIKAATDKQAMIAQASRDMAGRPDNENIISHNRDVQSSPLFTPEEKARVQAKTDSWLALPIEQRAAAIGNPGASAGEVSTAATALAGQRQVAATALAGQQETGRHNLVTEKNAAGQLGVSQGQLGVAQGNLAVNQENLAIRKAGQVELPPKEIQAREAKYPAATLALKQTVSSNEQLIQKLEKLRDHVGLGGITGVLYGRTPSLTEASREAQALLDQVQAQGGFQTLAAMRAASPTGGALGNVSDTEGKYLRASFAAMDPHQSAPSFKKAVDQAITELRGANERLGDAYNMTYEYRAPRAAPTVAPSPSALSPAEQAELDALRNRFKK